MTLLPKKLRKNIIRYLITIKIKLIYSVSWKKKKISGRKNKILIIVGVIAAVLAIIGGVISIIIWAKKNNSSSQQNSDNPRNNNDKKKEKYTCAKCNQEFDKKDKPPKDGKYCSDKCKNEDNKKYTCSNCNKEFNDIPTVKNGKKYCVNCKDKGDDENKVELKVYWSGSPPAFIEGYENHWAFASDTNIDRFLIPQNLPVLKNKKITVEEYFTLFYSENKVVKKVLKTGQGDAQIILLESGFTLTPDAPLTDDPDFLERFTKAAWKSVFFDYSQYSGGDYTFIEKATHEGVDEKDLDKYVFHPDHPCIQKLLAKNHLQNQPKRSDKEYEIRYLEKDIEKYDPDTRTYYLNNQAEIKPATLRP